MRGMADQAAYIVITGPGYEKHRQVLREGITSFGRLPSNDVILLGDLVSRNHARIIFFDGKASLQDLGSHNGSWVNEERVTTKPLNGGELVRIGNFHIEFHRGPPPEVRSFMDESTVNGEAARPTGRGAAAAGAPTAVPGPAGEAPGEHLSARAAGASRLVQEVGQATSGEGPVAESPGTLMLLYRVTEALSRATDLHSFLTEVLTFTIERVGGEIGAVFRAGAEGGPPERLAIVGPALRRGEPPVSGGVVRWAMAKNFTVYSRDIAADVRFRAGQSVELLDDELRALVCAPITLQERVLGALYLARPLTAPVAEGDIDAIEAIAHLVGVGMGRIDDRAREIRAALARDHLQRTYPPSVARRLLADARPPTLGAVQVATAFAGLQGFIQASDRATPDEVSAFLDAYVEAVGEAIHRHGGAVLPLLADELVAVFGAPYTQGDDVGQAVEAALAMRAAVERVAARFPRFAELRLGVGVDVGRVLFGPTGPARPWDATVLGEPVRVAARLRALAPGGSILVSAAVAEAGAGRFSMRTVANKPLRPRGQAEAVIEVLDATQGELGERPTNGRR
jgi:class 3 adenylate cyclase/pSer/pThr/pTyr-binding forkhead associated (FHA) protein